MAVVASPVRYTSMDVLPPGQAKALELGQVGWFGWVSVV